MHLSRRRHFEAVSATNADADIAGIIINQSLHDIIYYNNGDILWATGIRIYLCVAHAILQLARMLLSLQCASFHIIRGAI